MPVPENELGPYITRARVRYSSPELFRFDPSLHNLVLETMEAGVRRINQVPATDAFWHPSNMKPTVHKVGDYARRVLSTNPVDAQAWQVLASGALRFGEAESFIRHMEPLLSIESGYIRWLIPGLLWLRQNGLYPVCTSEFDPLTQVLTRVALQQPDLRGRLEKLQNDPDPYMAKSAGIAVQVLEGEWRWPDSAFASFLEFQSA